MHVRLYVKGWKIDHQVPLAEATVLLGTRLEFDGKEIDYSGSAYLNFGVAGGDFVTLQIGGVHPDDFERLVEVPENYTMGSTPERTGIIVSGLEIVEDSLPVGAIREDAALLRNDPR